MPLASFKKLLESVFFCLLSFAGVVEGGGGAVIALAVFKLEVLEVLAADAWGLAEGGAFEVFCSFGFAAWDLVWSTAKSTTSVVSPACRGFLVGGCVVVGALGLTAFF